VQLELHLSPFIFCSVTETCNSGLFKWHHKFIIQPNADKIFVGPQIPITAISKIFSVVSFKLGKEVEIEFVKLVFYVSCMWWPFKKNARCITSYSSLDPSCLKLSRKTYFSVKIPYFNTYRDARESSVIKWYFLIRWTANEPTNNTFVWSKTSESDEYLLQGRWKLSRACSLKSYLSFYKLTGFEQWLYGIFQFRHDGNIYLMLQTMSNTYQVRTPYMFGHNSFSQRMSSNCWLIPNSWPSCLSNHCLKNERKIKIIITFHSLEQR